MLLSAHTNTSAGAILSTTDERHYYYFDTPIVMLLILHTLSPCCLFAAFRIFFALATFNADFYPLDTSFRRHATLTP